MSTPKTRREYYDLLVAVSAAGKFPARNSMRTCKYRHAGRKCVAGLLIPDENYSSSIELQGCYEPDVVKVMVLPEGVTLEEVMALQKIHDNHSYNRLGDWDHNWFVQQINAVFNF